MVDGIRIAHISTMQTFDSMTSKESRILLIIIRPMAY